MTAHKTTSQSGSVFFYILLAVVLLAALSYAVSRGNRGSTSILTDQQAKLAAQEIIEYGETVANAVQKLRLRGCADTEISFDGSPNTNVSHLNPNAPSDESCHVFSNNGGNINSVLNWEYFESGMQVVGIGSSNGTSSSVDLILVKRLHSAATSDMGYSLETATTICEQINFFLHGETDLPLEGDITQQEFVGSYNYIGQMTEDPGRTSGCIMETASIITFYQVLIAR